MIYCASCKGKRPRNEDTYTISKSLDENIKGHAKVNLYGVYDGHGGKFVSSFLSERLPSFFTSHHVVYPLNDKYVHMVCDKIQETLFTKEQSFVSGSTCLLVCHFRNNKGDNCLNIINTGDSRCVLCNSYNIGVALNIEHKPDWPIEYNLITQKGGIVTNDSGVYRIGSLSLSRAFGDGDEAEYITHTPDVYLYTLNKNDKFIILACDGLWDVIDSQEAVNIVLKKCYDINMVRINKQNNIANILANMAIEKGSTDNVTCIVVFFHK